MSKASIFLFLLLFLVFLYPIEAQQLKPGFNAQEYYELMCISNQFGDSAYAAKFKVPKQYVKVYRSEPLGLDNMYELYINNLNQIVISLRGTTTKPESWLENFYAAMIPAKGSLVLGENNLFQYHFADREDAAVHLGWTLGAGFIYHDLKPRLTDLIESGRKEILLVGHSQGGAIGYLLAQQMQYDKQAGVLPEFTLKTYLSASPKPGNTYFAYTFEHEHKNMAFNVVNALDWVPETPVSIQTSANMNPVNPFVNVKDGFKNQKLSQRLVLSTVYRRINRPSNRAVKRYQKYLGKGVGKQVKDILPGHEIPAFANSHHYVRTGETIVLTPNKAYETYISNLKVGHVFVHHFHEAYLLLLAAHFPEVKLIDNSSVTLEGNWRLSKLEGGKKPLELLFPNGFPDITFDLDQQRISGNNGCNSYFGKFKANIAEGDFALQGPLGATRMYCEEVADDLFMQILENVTRFDIQENQLTVYNKQTVLAVFSRE
ncbi:MAG: META domain-containing protein [Luteibaculaceae bacterium]